MNKKSLTKIYTTVNGIRIIIVLFFISACVYDLCGIEADPDTYEKVYTGEFLGKYRYESLSLLISSLWTDIAIAVVYLTIILIHLLKQKKNRPIIFTLVIFDVAVIIYFIIYMQYIR